MNIETPLNEKCTVEAQPGRTVAFDRADAVGPDNALVVLKPGEQLDLVMSPAIRRRIRSGDLKVVEAKAAPAAAKPAPSPAKEK